MSYFLPWSSNNICKITPVIKKAKFTPDGLGLSLLVLFIDKLNIIEPITKLIKPIIADSVNKIHIDFTEKILSYKLKYLISNF
jgi:hypothetical protein